MSRRTFACLLLALTATAGSLGSGIARAADAGAGRSGPVTATALRTIEWREWTREAFDEAKAKRKLVLLDITATWCHWCRVMAEESYSDSSVIAEINANFIPIRVDYDLRPDIGDRYLTNGWPTTAILSANGHLLLAKTYLPPGPLREFLKEAVRFYRVNRQQVDRKVAEAERAVAKTWEPDSLLPPSISEEEYIERNIAALRDSEDKVNGGFGAAPKTAHWDAISFLLRAADARRDDDLRALAVRATVAALALQDSVDGGFFRFAMEPDWTKPRFERLLDEQAKALSILTRVYRATGEERFKNAADRAEDFARTHLYAGGLPRASHPALLRWRLSVGPDVRLRSGGWMEGDVYFRLSRAARRRIGFPEASSIFTTDAAARMSSILLQRDRSRRGSISSLRWTNSPSTKGERTRMGYHHAFSQDRRSGFGLLADHAAMGSAYLDLYESARDQGLLWQAESLASWMRVRLEDPVEGGFRYGLRDTAAIGRLKAGDKPEAANVEAATFFLRLYWLTGRQEYRDVAARTSRYLQSGDKIVLDPARAELALRLRQEPLRLLVIGKPGGGDSKLAWDLGTAALDAPVPEVVVRNLPGSPTPGRPISWPDGTPPNAVSPAIYRWTSTGWRGPVTDPSKLQAILDEPALEP